MKLLSSKNLFIFILILTSGTLTAMKCCAQLPSLIPSASNKKNGTASSTETMLRHSMFVKVIASKNKVFVGEPVMALYKFYVALHINDQPVVTKQPEFSDCSVKELNFEQGPEFENINNEQFAVYTIRKVQLTPLEAGTLSLGKAFVNNSIRLPNPEDPFNPEKYDITVNNADAVVQVTDLPKENRPADFYGITGNFTVETSVTNNKIPVNENGHLIITIKGSGNFDAINKPNVIWPAGTDHFDGSDSQHIDQNNFPISGDRVFDIPFVGKKEGAVTIPPIHFSYFNPQLKTYQTISTNAINVTFTKALPKADEYSGIVNYDISNRKYLWIVGAIALIAALFGFINYRRNKIQLAKKTIVQSTATPVPVFKPAVHFKYKTDFARHWNDLQSLTESKLFFTKAKELLMRAVTEFADTNHHAETFLLAEMKSKLKDETLCHKVFALIDACNEKMYAPFETETDLNFYFTEIKDTIEKLQALS